MNESRRSPPHPHNPSSCREGEQKSEKENKELKLDPCQSSVKDKKQLCVSKHHHIFPLCSGLAVKGEAMLSH